MSEEWSRDESVRALAYSCLVPSLAELVSLAWHHDRYALVFAAAGFLGVTQLAWRDYMAARQRRGVKA